MQSHRLVLENGPRDAEWLLEWDANTFALRDSFGDLAFAAETGQAHRLVDVYDLYTEGKVSFATPDGPLTFRPRKSVAAAVQDLVEAGLRRDAEFRTQLKWAAMHAVPRGLLMFVIAVGLFGLYGWWASRAPDPPPGHWLRWFGWLIHGVLLVLMGTALAGPVVCYHGLRQWLRIRRIERQIGIEDGDRAE